MLGMFQDRHETMQWNFNPIGSIVQFIAQFIERLLNEIQIQQPIHILATWGQNLDPVAVLT